MFIRVLIYDIIGKDPAYLITILKPRSWKEIQSNWFGGKENLRYCNTDI